MFNITGKTQAAWRSLQRLARNMATVTEPIGATKVPMSLLEPKAYINYQRIEDTLAVVRERYVCSWLRAYSWLIMCFLSACSVH